MTTLWKIIKRYPCITGVILFSFLVMMVRVQGNISTLLERTLVNFVSGVVVVTIALYAFLYIAGSLNPGDKPIFDFKQLGQKLLKGKSGDQSH